jgi:hypothetical protein
MDGTVDSELEDVASARAIISALEKAGAARKNHIVGALKIVGNLKKVPKS